jgi:hypothetical protein
MAYDKYDNDYEDEFEGDDESEMMEEVMNNSKAVAEAEIAIAEKSIKCELLDKSIIISRSTWVWWFLPHKVRLRRISQTFEKLKNMLR